MWKLQPSWEKTHPLFQQHPSKSWGPAEAPFLKMWLEVHPTLAEREGGCTLWASYLHTYSWHGILLWYILLFIISYKLSEIMRNYSNSSRINFKNLERYHWQCVKFCKKEFAKSLSKSAWLTKRVLISRNCKKTYFIILSIHYFWKSKLRKEKN